MTMEMDIMFMGSDQGGGEEVLKERKYGLLRRSHFLFIYITARSRQQDGLHFSTQRNLIPIITKTTQNHPYLP